MPTQTLYRKSRASLLQDRRPKHIKALSASLVLVCCMSFVAYAGVGDIVDSFISGLLSAMSSILVSICDTLIAPIFGITTMTIEDVSQYIPGFNDSSELGAFFVNGIQALGACIAFCLAFFSVFQLILSYVGNEKVESVGSVLWRIFVFLPLTFYGKTLLQLLFNEVITPISSAFAYGVLNIGEDETVFSNIATPIIGQDDGGLAVLVIGTVLIVMIGFNLISLVLEAAERYLICIVIIFLSPLAFAAGVNQSTTQVAKNWFRMFWSHCILLILNIWVVGIARTCLGTIDGSASTSQFIRWAIISYAYLKIAQKLDDILQNSGLLLTRTGGDFMRDALVAGTTLATAVRTAGDTVGLATGIHSVRKNTTDHMTRPEDIARPIQQFRQKHPILGVPATGIAHASNYGANYAQTKFAERSLNNTNDAARMAGLSKTNVNSAAYRRAVESNLNQTGRDMGFEKIGGKNGAHVEQLTQNPDGTLSGKLVQRDANGNIVRQTDFRMSNTNGNVDSLSYAHERTVKMSADGKSAIIEDGQNGTFKLEQTGVDATGKQMWTATQISDANGNDVSSRVPGYENTSEFSFRPDAQQGKMDGNAAQAAEAFINGGSMSALNENIENVAAARDDILAHDTDRMSGSAKIVSDEAHLAAADNILKNDEAHSFDSDTSKVEAISQNENGTVTAQMVTRNAAGEIEQASLHEISVNDKGEMEISDVGKMSFAPDGKHATIENENGVFQLDYKNIDSHGNQVWEASRVQDEGGNELDTADSGTQTFTFRPNTRNENGSASQAADQFMSSGTLESTVRASHDSMEHHAAVERDYNEASTALNTMTDEDRVAQMKASVPEGQEPAYVNYSSEGYRNAVANYMQENGLDKDIFDRGGEIVSQEIAPDGTLNGIIAVKDENNHVLEERHFSLSTESPATRTSGTGEPEIIPESERKIVGFVENTLECKYKADDDYSGYVETSNIGQATLSRVSVDDETGVSKWQLVHRGADAQDESDGVVTFERKGKRGGASETIFDVIKDLKYAKSFDEAALIDYKNKNRKKD